MKTKNNSQNQPSLQQIPLATLRRNPQQQREDFDADELLDLGNSIKNSGLRTPIHVEDAGDGTYIVRDGERRWRASEMVGLSHINAIVRPMSIGDASQDRLLEVLITATQRKDLNPVEFARGCGELRKLGLNNTQIADRIGVRAGKVAAALEMLQLDNEILHLIADASIHRSERVVRALLSVENKEARIKLAMRAANARMSINAIESACAKLNEALPQQQPKPPASHAPSITLAPRRGNGNDTARWAAVRAAAQGSCDHCDNNPRLPGAPEPAWWLIMQKATDTCNACSLRPDAIKRGLSICNECPAVDLLQRLASAT